jgi:GNAT superfamily N-acetyltransferase
MAEVVTWREEWRDAFERLNREWIETWFELEAADRETFGDPQGKIVDPGGQIFFALDGSEPVGTCAMVRCEPGVYELAKMAVAPAVRGRGYGDLLMGRRSPGRGMREGDGWSSCRIPGSRPRSGCTGSTGSSRCRWRRTSGTRGRTSGWSGRCERGRQAVSGTVIPSAARDLTGPSSNRG